MSVKYRMKYDASEMMSMVSASSLSDYGKLFPSDSVFSFADIIAEYRDSTKTLSAEDQQMMEDLKSFTCQLSNDTVAKTFFVLVSGNFDDTATLNRILKTISEQKSKTAEESGRSISDRFDNISEYFWDGKNMKRIIQPKDHIEQQLEEGSIDKNMMDLFSAGKMVVKYHFPRRVVNVSNPDALFSQDGKTVVVEYPATDFIDSADKINIEITTE
ncbi:hypothetical protein D0T84_05255 [Dysgonomonas sp. 521]|nr:hypothetical protein [Dysgonomonas sp. 521]